MKYLGFGFWKSSDGWKSRPHQDSVRRFKLKLKKLTQRKWSIDLTRRIEQLNLSIRGWINYFSLGNMKRIVTSIDQRLRTRLRVIIWKQWKKKSRLLWGLLKLGVPKWIADKVSGWGDHYQLGLKGRYLNVIYQNQSSKSADWFLTWFTTLNGMYHGVSGVSLSQSSI